MGELKKTQNMFVSLVKLLMENMFHTVMKKMGPCPIPACRFGGFSKIFDDYSNE